MDALLESDGGGLCFIRSDTILCVKNLTLEIREFDTIVVNNPDPPYEREVKLNEDKRTYSITYLRRRPPNIARQGSPSHRLQPRERRRSVISAGLNSVL